MSAGAMALSFPLSQSLVANKDDTADDRGFKRTADKALAININTNAYGSIAEIGAGQEVARWLFRVGGAAGTVARSISAYDKTVSDTIYGQAKRFVTNERLEAMLDVEYQTCVDALDEQRGETSRFFSFADTVTAKAYTHTAFGRDNDCHGWLGIKMQLSPREEPVKIMIHCRLKDATFQAQQPALGVLGINFMHGAINWDGDLNKLLRGLQDDLTLSRIEVDSVMFSGEAFQSVDEHAVALRLVQFGLAEAVMFDSKGRPNVAQNTLYKKNIMLLRGRFRPFTKLHNDMLVLGGSFDECVRRDDTLVLLEMSIHDLMQCPENSTVCKVKREETFINRLVALSTMGYSVMVTGHREHFKIGQYLRVHTKGKIVYCVGVPALREILKEEHYQDLEGGILESFGRLFKAGTRIYVYPTQEGGQLTTANNLRVDPKVQLLYDYMVERGLIRHISHYNKDTVTQADYETLVDDLLHKGDAQWEQFVPMHVAAQIRAMGLKDFEVAKEIAGN
eukprot:jgi/Tetstr1/457955/TSEL_044468.t1